MGAELGKRQVVRRRAGPDDQIDGVTPLPRARQPLGPQDLAEPPAEPIPLHRASPVEGDHHADPWSLRE